MERSQNVPDKECPSLWDNNRRMDRVVPSVQNATHADFLSMFQDQFQSVMLFALFHLCDVVKKQNDL
jgi:hypothetical protein